jgi:hypothetical protein
MEMENKEKQKVLNLRAMRIKNKLVQKIMKIVILRPKKIMVKKKRKTLILNQQMSNTLNWLGYKGQASLIFLYYSLKSMIGKIRKGGKMLGDYKLCKVFERHPRFLSKINYI